MPDSKIQTALLSLLRAGLWGEAKLDGTVLPLSAAEWIEVYQAAKQHTVEGIVFDGVQYLPANDQPPRELLLKWTVKVDQLERHYKKMNLCIEEQLELFNSNELYPVLLKGQGIASCYKIPEHRVCGDVDWYFERKLDYRRANDMLAQKGVNIEYTAGFSSEYRWKDIVVEHHQRMFDIHNPFSFMYLNRLQRRFRRERLTRKFQGKHLILPAPTLMILQVNAHILKHLLSFGVGIRQLCDSARVYYTFQAKVDGKELKQIYQRLGILKWIHLLHAVLVKFIGLPETSLPFELPEGTDADWMMDEIWVSGNFGFYDSRFMPEGKQPLTSRNHATYRVWSNLRRYIKFAPMEAVSFPIVHLYSKIAGK